MVEAIKKISRLSKSHKPVKIMLIIFGVLLTSFTIIIVLLQAVSPGKPKPFLDESGNLLAGSISEKIFVDINGVNQGMFIKSKDSSNPVLLYLHGGMPDYFLTQKYPTGLDEYFTVVWWEQRGSGISYHPDIPVESMNVEQLIADTLAITEYLCDRFHQDKIYLLGHSGGTFIGIQAAERAPQLYHAYIGMAQISYQLESEKLAYDYMLQEFKNNGNKSMVKKLDSAPVTLETGIPAAYNRIRDAAMHSLGIGTMHEMKSVISGIFFPSLAFREYSLKDKLNLWQGKSKSGISSVWDEIIVTDLSKNITTFEIPVYFLCGSHDYTVSTHLAKQYFKKIQAPIKGFYIFDNSAHSPIFEEPEKFEQVMFMDVLQGSNYLADIK